MYDRDGESVNVSWREIERGWQWQTMCMRLCLCMMMHHQKLMSFVVIALIGYGYGYGGYISISVRFCYDKMNNLLSYWQYKMVRHTYYRCTLIVDVVHIKHFFSFFFALVGCLARSARSCSIHHWLFIYMHSAMCWWALNIVGDLIFAETVEWGHISLSMCCLYENTYVLQ